MLILLIRAAHIGDGLLVAETSQRIDMAIGIVSRQIATLDPKDTLQPEDTLQVVLQRLLIQILIAIDRGQALHRSHQRPFSVGLNTAPFQHERLHIHGNHLLSEGVHLAKPTGDQIVEVSGKLHTPSVEDEIIKHRLALLEDRDATVIACPRVVRLYLPETDPTIVHITQLRPYLLLVWTNNE